MSHWVSAHSRASTRAISTKTASRVSTITPKVLSDRKRRGAEAGIVKVLIPAERDKDCRHKGCHLPDKADDKVGGNADEQPLLGKLRGKGTGQICVQQCARDKGQYNQKHCRPDGDILGSDAAEIRCKPAATDRVGSQHAAKCKNTMPNSVHTVPQMTLAAMCCQMGTGRASIKYPRSPNRR